MMKASVIITAWGESTTELTAAARGVKLSEDSVLETVLVINNYDKDPRITKEIVDFASGNPDITRWVVCSHNIGVARAWNIGVNLCEGDIYIVLNGDCVLGAGAVEKLLVPFSNKLVGVVGVGGMRSGKKVNTNGLCENVHGFCFALRRATYHDTGGFDNYFSPLADEIEFCARVWDKGWGVFIAEDVNFTHEYRISTKLDEDIIYLGRKLDRRKIDSRNSEYKLKLPWLGKISYKKRGD